MTKQAGQFVEVWVANNIQATGYEPEGDMTAANAAAFEMLAAADKAGIARGAVEAYTGNDIVAFMADKIESVNDAEVERLSSKDD